MTMKTYFYIPYNKREHGYRYQGKFKDILDILYFYGKDCEKDENLYDEYESVKNTIEEFYPELKVYFQLVDILKSRNILVISQVYLRKSAGIGTNHLYVTMICRHCGRIKSVSLYDLFIGNTFQEHSICNCVEIENVETEDLFYAMYKGKAFRGMYNSRMYILDEVKGFYDSNKGRNVYKYIFKCPICNEKISMEREPFISSLDKNVSLLFDIREFQCKCDGVKDTDCYEQKYEQKLESLIYA